MPPSNGTSRSGVSRKVLGLALAVIAVSSLYSIGWYIAADQLKSGVLASLENDATAAPRVACSEPTAHGFPFRIGVFCSSIAVDDLSNGIAVSAGAFRSAAQVYRPSHIVWELDGPSQFRSALGLAGSADWSLLQASTQSSDGRLQSTSLSIRGMTSSLTETISGQTADLASDRFEVHTRRVNQDLETAMLVEKLTGSVRGMTQTLPPVAASIDLVVSGRADLLDGGSDFRTDLYGTSGVVRRLVADLGEGRVVTVSGPISVGPEGLISGEFDVSIEKLSAWNETLTSSFPPMAKVFNAATSILRSLASGADNASARIVVREGVVMLSFIPIGTLPPL